MRSRTLLIALVAALVVPVLSAQMNPGSGGMGRMPGVGTRGGMPVNGMLASDMMELPVAPDGTVFVVKKSATGSSYDLVAISASGAVRWSYPLTSTGMSFAAISGNALVLSSGQSGGTSMAPTFTSQLIAISIASGSKLWTVDLNGGAAMGITTYSDGFYVVVVNATPSLSRKLISVGNDGNVRWTVGLD